MSRPPGHKVNRAALEDFMKVRGSSITKLAAESGIPRATISSLLGGHHSASVPVAHKFAEILDCDPRTLFPTLGGFAVKRVDVAAAS